MEEKEGSQQRENLSIKNRKMGQPNKENDGCKKWEKQGSQLGEKWLQKSRERERKRVKKRWAKSKRKKC